jgi:serine phosphatase RsbU (regulator of sigma subunit)/anti-sigma regulatory factor (Ser/Thr protein kinase)
VVDPVEIWTLDDRSNIVGGAFAQSPTPWWIYAAPDLRLVAANRRARALLANAATMPRVDGCIEFWRTAYQEVLDTGEPRRDTRWREVVEGPNGPEELWWSFLLTAVRAADGTITAVSAQGFDVTEEERRQRAVERQAAQSEADYRASREVVAQLQHAMLPRHLPVLPRLSLAARYLVAGEGQLAGGDWFDVLPLDDGTVALVVGDVVGHGVEASLAMGQLRTVLTSQLTDGVPLEAALRRAERFAASTAGVRATTAVVAVLTPATGRLSYATCGQPPPLIVSRDGTARYLPLSGAGPLGLGSVAPLAEDRLVPGDVLVLYTDGLVERRGHALDAGLAELAAVAGDAVAGRIPPARDPTSLADAVCQSVTDRVHRGTTRTDDLTVLTVALLDRVPPPLGFRVPARTEALTTARQHLDSWLGNLGLRGAQQTELTLMATEAISNAVEHAYAEASAPGSIDVTGRLLNDGTVALTVSDQGTWRVPTAELGMRGHGLAIMEELASDLNVIRRTNGTSVELWYRLMAPVDLDAGGVAALESVPARPDEFTDDFTVAVEQGPGRTVLHCAGIVDAATAASLAWAICRAGETAGQPVVVDLSDLRLLASAGVQVLLTRPVTLVAAPGSPARAVLDLVGAGPVADRVPAGDPT